MKTMVKVLDCTLRDGGYVNHFAFGERRAQQILSGIAASGVEYIEVGFLKDEKAENETTIFSSVDELCRLGVKPAPHYRICAMVECGKFSLDKLPPKSDTPIDVIRVIFKKDRIDEAFAYMQEIQKKGYAISANPTVIHSYSDRDFLQLLERINLLHPEIFALVDTLGVLKRNELLRLLYLIEHNLDAQIALAFHSHNNLQMSFAHAQTLIEAGMQRELIIDTSLRGMGRGAGNLCTELLLQYLNDTYHTEYNLVPILIAIDEHIDKIYAQTPWGYNLPYYLAASQRCHPNYAAYLVDKGTVSVEGISEILSMVPDAKRTIYDKKLISDLYFNYQNEEVDDSQTLEDLKQLIGQREVLLLGPGKTLSTARETIHRHIAENAPCIFSINYRPRHIQVDKVFVSNARRFVELVDHSGIVATSNIRESGFPKLNYRSYLNESEMPDNAFLMILQILVRIGVRRVCCAGLDGFGDHSENYYRTDIGAIPIISGEDKRNEEISSVLRLLNQLIEIHFITPTLYQL